MHTSAHPAASAESLAPPPLALCVHLQLVKDAEAFIAGFEGAADQEDVPELLRRLRLQIARLSAPMPAPVLASSRLSIEERARWLSVLEPLLKYAGSPGDWDRESVLGKLTIQAMQARAGIVAEPGDTA
jgi:hypothetical protein